MKEVKLYSQDLFWMETYLKGDNRSQTQFNLFEIRWANMIWLLVPVIIWIMALIIMGLPRFVDKKVQKLKVELKVDAKLAKPTNPDESIYKNMEKGILEVIHFQNLCLISSIIGLLLMALGTVALCVVLAL